MAKAPAGKKILNTHISVEEYNFLKDMAARNAMTITMYLRGLIRAEMDKLSKESNLKRLPKVQGLR